MGKRSYATPAYDPGESKSVSCRKIDNGYIVTESHSGKDGYHSCERYSATKPKLEVEVSTQGASKSAPRRSTSSLGDASKYLDRK